jgi:hypothetical protein
MGLQLSGSVQLEGNLLVTGSANSVFENITVTNRITANEINVQFVSSSIIYSSGSNRFGDEITDNHQFTGSVDVSGSVTATTLIRRGGTSSEFLMADGSVNTNILPSGDYVTLDTTQLITGQKTFNSGARFENEIYLKHDPYVNPIAGYTAIGSDADNIFLAASSTKYAVFNVGNLTGQRTYNLPDLDGALALTSSLSSYLPLSGGTLIGALNGTSATFSSGLINGTTDAFFDLNRSASGNASRVRFQTVGTDEFEIGLKGGVPGFHITRGDATELLTISGSNVGIGIIPNTWAGTNTKALQVYLGSMAASLTFGTTFTFNSHYDGNWRYIGSYNAGKYDIGGNEHIWYSAPSGTAGDTISFVEMMKLDSSSRLGINYNNSAIHTYGSSAYSAQLTVKASSASALTLLNSTTGGDAQVAINFVNEFTSGQYNYIARIIAEPEGSWTSTASTRDSRLSFLTTLNGVTSEAMRITSGRSMLLATTTDTGAVINVSGSYMNYPVSIEAQPGGGQLALTRGGAVGEFYMGGSTGGTTEIYVRSGGSGGVRLDSGTTGWVSASDIRLKDIEKPIDNAVQSLQGLQTIYYSWKASQDKKLHLGLIAQEVEAVFPEIVSESSIDEMKGVNYMGLIPVLIKAIQEQQTQIEELKSRVDQLENN